MIFLLIFGHYVKYVHVPDGYMDHLKERKINATPVAELKISLERIMILCYNKFKKGGVFMYKSKMMIVMRRDLKMRKGKIAAQAGHACIDAVLMALHKEGRMNDFEMTDEGFSLKTTNKPISPLSDWFIYGCAKVCVYVDSEEALLAIEKKAKEKGIIASVITDAGMTEFHGVPTKTCLALEPLPTDIADELTGGLPLY